jgi:selenocysteine-specific elongation factor
VDRAFTIRGAGTVVTGTLVEGRLAEGDQLLVPRTGATVTARGLQCLRTPVAFAAAAARVAVNLRRAPAASLRRGDALLAPGGWLPGREVDVRHSAERLPRELIVHIGTAAMPAAVRALDRRLARLRLAEAVGLHVGDRLVLRAPGTRTLTSAVVLDPQPPTLPRQRGAGVARAAALAEAAGVADPAAELRRRGVASGAFLRAIGVQPIGPALVGDWYVDPGHAERLRRTLADLTRPPASDRDDSHIGLRELPATEVARRLGLPDPRLVAVLGLSTPVRPDPPASVWRSSPSALEVVPAERLAMTRAELSAAVSSGALIRIGRGYLTASAVEDAVTVLRDLPQPFTVSQARQALDVSRAVTLLLLQHLDRTGVTEIRADLTRAVRR